MMEEDLMEYVYGDPPNLDDIAEHAMSFYTVRKNRRLHIKKIIIKALEDYIEYDENHRKTVKQKKLSEMLDEITLENKHDFT